MKPLFTALAIAAALALSARAGPPVVAQAEKPGPVAPAAQAPLTPREREERTTQLLARMTEQAGQVDQLVAQARSEKDIVKLNCVNEKVNEVHGLLRVSGQSAGELHEADARHEDDAADHAWAKVSIAGRKIQQLREDAEQCIGQLAFYNDDKTVVEIEVPAGLPSNDPTLVPVPGGVDSRPPPASGF